MSATRLGFFSRLLDAVPDADRYRLATEQIQHAEAHGFSTAWVAQHHFDGEEGGLPSPLVFLSSVAAVTRSIRLGTGIITLPLENAVRVAEDASVLDVISGGRVEIGVGSGGTPSSFPAFGQVSSERGAAYAQNLEVLRHAWTGGAISGSENVLFPAANGLADRIWQATFSISGGQRAGAAGDGLMLSRTQPRPADAPQATLWDMQLPIIDAYLNALPAGRTPRIMGSRSVFVADDRAEARRFAELGYQRHVAARRARGLEPLAATFEKFLDESHSHFGTPADVIESLGADRALDLVNEVSFQVHSVDPPHAHILRSIELIATEVAPALGWNAPADHASTIIPTTSIPTAEEAAHAIVD